MNVSSSRRDVSRFESKYTMNFSGFIHISHAEMIFAYYLHDELCTCVPPVRAIGSWAVTATHCIEWCPVEM